MDRETRDLEKHLQRTPRKKDNQASQRQATSMNGHQHLIYQNDEPNLPQSTETNGDAITEFEAPETYEEKIYKEISYLNGQINRMDLNELKMACKGANVDCHGRKDPLKKRLKEHWKVKKLVEAGLLDAKKNRNADYFCIVDFEATCEERNPAGYPHEIVEFPAVLVSSVISEDEEPHIVDVFQSYVRPVINPKLSEFCKTLTGIEQEVVDKADVFEDVLKKFEAWMQKHGLGTEKSYVLITDGPFDMGRFMYLQCQQSGIPFPEHATYWSNLRKVFVNFYKESFYAHSSNSNNNLSPKQLPGLATMLDRLDMEFEGQPHCGLDDAKNIARIAIRLLKDKAVIRVNEKLQKVGKGVDDSNRCNGRLFSVVPVNKREGDKWFNLQKKHIQQSSGSSGGEEC